MADLIWIGPAKADGRVSLWERNPEHPGGEVWVGSGDPPVLAARTREVEKALREGRIVETAHVTRGVWLAEPEPLPPTGETEPGPQPPAEIAPTDPGPGIGRGLAGGKGQKGAKA